MKLADAVADPDQERRNNRILNLTYELHTAGKFESRSSNHSLLRSFMCFDCSVDLNEFVTGVRWFKRLWVVQEVAMARDASLVYGHSQASLRAILEARMILKSLDKGDGADRAGAGAAYMALWNAFAVHDLGTGLLNALRTPGRLDDVTLCKFMAEARFSGCTDSRDKILALYSILSDFGVPSPAPDYSKSTATIYREATIAMIQSTSSLRILEQVDGLGSTADLPSWVPDWSSSKHSIGQEEHNCLTVPMCEASFQTRDFGRQLILKGVIVDSIATRSTHAFMHVDERLGAPENYVIWTKNPQLHDPWWKMQLEAHPEHSSTILRLWNVRALKNFVSVALDDNLTAASQERVHALYYVLMSNVRHDVAEENERKAQSWFQTLCSTSDDEKADTPSSKPPDATWMRNRRYLPQISPQSPIMEELGKTAEYQTLQRIAGNRTFDAFHSRIDRIRYKTIFKTTSGRIGLAPWSIKNGDKIALFSGFRLPVVIRRVGSSYKLIAQAYVEGMMHGEGWPQHEAELSEICLT